MIAQPYSRAAQHSGTGWSPRAFGALLLVCLLHLALLWHFHDRFWYATDDGFYAHIAERVLAGEVLHRDVQDIHPGAIHGLHAVTFTFVGVDMVHLRYPLMACSLLQVVFTFLLLARRGAIVAVTGATLAGTVGVVQFFSPNPNWYCLTLAVALACWLVERPEGSRYRLLVAGGIVGMITALRHLSGVWAAMGLLVVVLLELHRRATGAGVLTGRVLAAIMLAGTSWYVMATPGVGPGGMLLMVACPLALLVTLALSSRAANRDVLGALGEVGTGALLAMLPLIAYYTWHGVIGEAAIDLVARAWGETRLPFFQPLGWYVLLPLMGLLQLTSAASLSEAANGVYWVLLPTASLVNGVLVLRHLERGNDVRQVIPGVLAAFFALVSVLLEGPFYLYYSVGFSLTALLWHSCDAPRELRQSAVALGAGIAIVAVACHAGQTMDRSGYEILRGQRSQTTPEAQLTGMRASIVLPQPQVEAYARLVSRIRAQVSPSDSILVLPNDAQLYFLAGRRNMSRFYNAALGLHGEDELRTFLAGFDARPPALVIYRAADKYETQETREVMRLVRNRYHFLGIESGRELYARQLQP